MQTGPCSICQPPYDKPPWLAEDYTIDVNLLGASNDLLGIEYALALKLDAPTSSEGNIMKLHLDTELPKKLQIEFCPPSRKTILRAAL